MLGSAQALMCFIGEASPGVMLLPNTTCRPSTITTCKSTTGRKFEFSYGAAQIFPKLDRSLCTNSNFSYNDLKTSSSAIAPNASWSLIPWPRGVCKQWSSIRAWLVALLKVPACWIPNTMFCSESSNRCNLCPALAGLISSIAHNFLIAISTNWSNTINCTQILMTV